MMSLHPSRSVIYFHFPSEKTILDHLEEHALTRDQDAKACEKHAKTRDAARIELAQTFANTISDRSVIRINVEITLKDLYPTKQKCECCAARTLYKEGARFNLKTSLKSCAEMVKIDVITLSSNLTTSELYDSISIIGKFARNELRLFTVRDMILEEKYFVCRIIPEGIALKKADLYGYLIYAMQGTAIPDEQTIPSNEFEIPPNKYELRIVD